jgi:hypothetical protein
MAVSAAIRTPLALTGAVWVTLTAATGCDKAKALAHNGGGSRPVGVHAALRAAILDSVPPPRILFEVFGERSDPRMLPIAVIDGHGVRNIDLSPLDWLRFDRRYNQTGTSYSLFQDGHAVGTATVMHRMWENPTKPLVTLPNCKHIMPLAAVSIDKNAPQGITAEFLASNAPLSASRAGTELAPPVAVDVARRLAQEVGKNAHIPIKRLDSLDFHATAIHTGATSAPTIIASFLDPAAGGFASHATTTTYVFVIADETAIGYAPTYQLTVNGPALGATYRRFIDHLDLTGDGVDELILETWTYGDGSNLTVMKWDHSHWTEIFNGSRSWCLDPTSSAPAH